MGRYAVRSQSRLKLIHIYLLLLAACSVLTIFGCGNSTEPMVDKSTAGYGEQPDVKWPDPNTPEGKFVGRYMFDRGFGKDDLTYSTTLQPDMSALLSIEYRGIRHPTEAFRGTWSVSKDRAICRFTDHSGKPIDTTVVYEMQNRRLVSVQWDKELFGKEPMSFRHASGGPARGGS